jgi:kynurenine formamidase
MSVTSTPAPEPGAGAIARLLGGLRTFDLEHERHPGAPFFPAHTPGFHYALHRRHEPGTGQARTSASGLIVANEHNGTHLDALCHQAVDLCLHGGRKVDPDVQTPFGFDALGAETIEPLIARGVLLDVAASAGVERLPDGHLVGAEELERASRRAGVEPQAGDVVLVRTGNDLAWEDPAAYLRGPGVGSDGARWLARRRPLAVGADNVAFDVVGHVDPQLGELPAHIVLIVDAGVYIIENLRLDRLADHGVAELVFICLPLKLRGATGSPVRPIALARPA